MLGVLNPFQFDLILQQPWLLILFAFQVWMLVDAIRREEWLWAVLIFIFPILNALLYFFLVYRAQPRVTQGFELPGTHQRSRVKELQAQIHNLDKAHHHAELADIYFQDGKLTEAEQHYRAALEREPGDADYQAHLGQCLLRQGRAEEAVPLLEAVAQSNPKHEYGYTLMAYAEVLQKLGRKDEAVRAWEQVLESNSYARARVQLAELYIEQGRKDVARRELTEVLADERHTAAFQRKQEKVWTRRAKALLKQIGEQ